jgi:hypothetical protein
MSNDAAQTNRLLSVKIRTPSSDATKTLVLMMKNAVPLYKALGDGRTILGGYGIIAYIVLPLTWTHYEHQKGLAGLTMLTRTVQGIQGDPINVGFFRNER